MGRAESYAEVCFLCLQMGMMVELSRQPPNLDKLMNEGIAFAIDVFK